MRRLCSFLPNAEALGVTLAYYEKYTYFGPGSHQTAIALANKAAEFHTELLSLGAGKLHT